MKKQQVRKNYIGIVKEVPEKGKSLTIRKVPEVNVRCGILRNVHLVSDVQKVTELPSDDYRCFTVETRESIYHVVLVP